MRLPAAGGESKKGGPTADVELGQGACGGERRLTGSIARRATVVLALLASTVAMGLVLLIAFDPSVQTASAGELVKRQGAARAFLIVDFFFVVVYGVLLPIAIWRFGSRLSGGRPPGWVAAAALLLLAAGVVDAVENALLLSATGSVSVGRVDAAHTLEAPKVVLFVAGAVMALAVNYRAARVLRGSAGGVNGPTGSTMARK